MQAATQTFASSITVCAECKEPITYQLMKGSGSNGATTNMPCGHTADFLVVPNPLLGERDA